MRTSAARVWNGIGLVWLTWVMAVPAASAAPPILLNTPGFGSPESGAGGDLLMLAGDRLSAGDTIAYQALGTAAGESPAQVLDGARVGAKRASVIQVGEQLSFLTMKLPDSMSSGTIYRIWVVSPANEWSAPLVINQPRPIWISPPFVYATRDAGGLGRRIRLIGRNMQPGQARPGSVRLTGVATYTLETSTADTASASSMTHYVADAVLPQRLAPGKYKTSFSRDGQTWTEVPDQSFEVRPDPQGPQLSLDSAAFGDCRPNVTTSSDTCLERAINAAQQLGGATITLPPGVWNFSGNSQFALPLNVNLAGAGAELTRVVRHDPKPGAPGGSMFVLAGHNSVTGIGFSATPQYHAPVPGMAILQLGAVGGVLPVEVSDIIISGNTFLPVGQAIVHSGHPISRLLVTNNLFGAYQVALELPGDRFNVSEPFRIDDSVIRSNRFVPGSYLDISAHQGSFASELGAGNRVDFSRNIADGTSIEALQDPDDPKGWRAAFFWNLNNNQERLLVAENQISCPGDKVGDGEAIAFDSNGSTFAFNGTAATVAATTNTITVRGALLGSQNGRPVDRNTYYNERWIQVVEGTGIGQVRQIRRYQQDTHNGTVEFHVEPAWDVLPLGARIIVGPEFYQVYALANEIDQRLPTCTKRNLTGPKGGAIAMWAPSAASVIEGNLQYDTSGITFQHMYTVTTPSCPRCASYSTTQIGLEIRGNRIDGEYDWSSDCSWSGVFGSFGASATPESPPPTLGFGISIAHNQIRHADGLGGGAIDFAPTWNLGPPPFNWPMIQALMVYQNVISDIQGSAPRSVCGTGQRLRVGMRLGGSQNVSHALFNANRCSGVPEALEDRGRATAHTCATGSDCLCDAQPE